MGLRVVGQLDILVEGLQRVLVRKDYTVLVGRDFHVDEVAATGLCI